MLLLGPITFFYFHNSILKQRWRKQQQQQQGTMAAESFFGKIADDVEKIATRMEEGWNVSMTGELPNEQQEQPPIHGVGGSGSVDNIDLDEFDLDGLTEQEIQELLSEEMMQNSPLAGIADSVLGDIMAGQVSVLFNLRQ